MFAPIKSETPEISQRKQGMYQDRSNPNIFASATQNPATYASYQAPSMTHSMSVRRQDPNALSTQRGSIPMISPSQSNQQLYATELQKQMEAQQQRKKASREARAKTPVDYFPFGKPGAGAPFRDKNGHIISQRPPHYNENDPNWLRTSEYYKTIAEQGVRDPNAPPDYMMMASPVGQSQTARQPIYAPPEIPAQFNPADAPLLPGTVQQLQPPPFDEKMEKQQDATVKVSYANALQEQMEEKRRREEEEKRQRILEERMEEARLEKQRRELEEEFKREQEEKRKKFQEVQAFNEQNFVVQKQTKNQALVGSHMRQSDIMQEPVDPPRTPPREPPDFRPPPPKVVEKLQSEVPIEITKNLQSNMENEVWKLRNEVSHQQNELRDNIVRLKEEAQLANEMRYNSQQDLEKIKDAMRQRQYEDDIRSRELYNALVLKKNPMGLDPITRMPAYKPKPLNLPRQRNIEPYLSDGDASKSLQSESKFVPMAKTGQPHLKPGEMPPDPTDIEIKAAIKVPSDFISLPENGPGNLELGTLDPPTTISSSIGVDHIDRKNEERLRMLERAEQGLKKDELAKLDDLLFSYLNENKKDHTYIPASRGRAYEALHSIAEADDDEVSFSLVKPFYGQAAEYSK